MNKKDKKIIIIGIVILFLVIIGLVIVDFVKRNKASIDTTDKINMNLNTDDDDEKIDWSNYQSTDYTLTKSINITNEGIYNLTGTIEDGQITIDTTGNVKLVLNNVTITNSNGPAIFVKNASDVVIELKEGSKNYLEDSSTYTGYEEDEIGTIFSHDDLTLQGTGELEVVSNLEDAIVSKDDLKIISGTYKITAADDGIRGKDSVYILGGNFEINAASDGIKSTNDTDRDKGFIKIEDGTFTIVAGQDGIQAETQLLIQNGDFSITTGNGSSIESTSSQWGNWGLAKTTSDTTSAKGIKANSDLLIQNGNFNLNTSDDSIHSNNYIGIKDGNFTISSGDDGIHADEELIIDNGTINIIKSYEGLEASKITINNGKIDIVSSDDGINVAGGNDASSQNGRPGQNNFSSNTNNILTINGGTISVNASGDGLDANGSIYITGGYTVVYGPSDSGNGALDYDQTFEVTGGTLLAGGSSGMLQSCSSSSKIYNVSIVFTSSYSSNDKITIVDSNNKEIASYQSPKSYNSLIIASPDLKKGETYTIKVNETTYKTFTIDNITTTVGSMNNMGLNQGMGGNPKGDHDKRR